MRQTILILTATRAEYSLLKPVIFKLKEQGVFEIKLLVTGAHLSHEFGLTRQEIENDNLVIDKEIEILLSSDTPAAISKSMGVGMISFSDYLKDLAPKLMLVLGDRYEILAFSIVAMNQNIPIAHLYGGESTEGLIDEATRHSITKMSYLHFASTEIYRNRIIQLGEHPERVFNVGSIGVENINKTRLYDRKSLAKKLNFSLDKHFAVVTYHPVTLENKTSSEQFKELLTAISKWENMSFIFTKANSDAHGRIINQMIDEFVSESNNSFATESLGMKKYLSTIKHSCMVIGNSSSGIIEVPSFNVPTINIGDRQKGRLKSKSVIDCQPTSNSINSAMSRAFDDNFLDEIKTAKNPYEKSESTSHIVTIINDFITNEKIDLKKPFYDISNREKL